MLPLVIFVYLGALAFVKAATSDCCVCRIEERD